MRAALIISALAVCACATTGPRPEGPVVEKLEIDGTSKISEGELKKKILTAEKGFLPEWLPGVPEDPRFDANAWQADLRRIERYYQANGYYSAKVLDDEVNATDPEHVELKVTVVEGEPTTLRKLEVRGLDGLAPEHKARVLDGLPLRESKVFLEDDWTETKPTVAARLRELGYAEASVTGEAHVDVATRTAEATLEAQPGTRYKFGKIFVAQDANAKVGPKAIIEQVEEAVKPGDWYSESALSEAQARVFKMGIFGAVKVNRAAPDRESGTVPIVVDVREAPFHTRRTGGGVGFDQTRNEGRLIGEYTDRNFFGGLRRYTLRGKVGYAFLPNIVSTLNRSPGASDGVFLDVFNELEQPRFLRPDLNLNTSLELQRGLDPAFSFVGGNFKTGVVWRPRSDISVFPSLNVDLFLLTAAAPLGGAAPPVTFGCGTTCLLSYLEQTVEIDRRDNRNEPHRGWYASISFQEGAGAAPVPLYLRAMPDVRGYVSFGDDDRFTVSGRLRVGTLLPLSGGTSPIVVRFYGGGGSSMRGFNSRRMSPLVLTATGATLPVGGDGLLDSSLELRYHLTDEIVLAVFGDSGFVTAGPFPTNPASAIASLYAAVGLGARYITPLGPVRIDVAYRLPLGPPLPVTALPGATAGDPVTGRCFGIGNLAAPGYAGSPDDLCTLHLSIGEAF